MASHSDSKDSSKGGSKASGGRSYVEDSKTSNFDSSHLVSDDGKFFGLTLSPGLTSQANALYPAVVDWLRRKGEEHGIPLAQKFGKEVMKLGEADAMKFGNRAGNAIGYGIIFSKQIGDVVGNVYDSVRALGDLNGAVTPVVKANASTITSGDNEVISNARGKISNIFWQRMGKTATGAIAIAPALMFKLREETARTMERERELEYAKAKDDPEAMAKLLEREAGLKIGGSLKDAEGMRLVLEGQEKRYIEQFDAFKKQNLEKTKRDIRAELSGDLVKEPWKADRLTKYGLRFDPAWTRETPVPTGARKGTKPTPPVTGEAQFRAYLDKQINKVAEDKLKGEFVRTHGAFNNEWTRYAKFGLDKEAAESVKLGPTIKEQITDMHKQYQERLHGNPNDPHAKDKGKVDAQTSEVTKLGAGFAAGVVGEIFTNAFGGKENEKFKKPIALDRILNLRRVLEKAGETIPEKVPGVDGSGDRDCSYTKYIHDIFNTHQQDCKRAEIGERYFEHFEKARWDDKAIIAMEDKDLTPYEVALRHMAKRIRDGRMDALALVNLVGDKKSKIVQASGKDFGPTGTPENEEEAKAAIMAEIEKQTRLFRPQVEMDEQKVNEALGALVFSVDEIKQAFSPSGLQGDERAFLYTLIETQVPHQAALCRITGMSEKQCGELRGECQERFNAYMDAGVQELADMIQHNPDRLAEMKMTEEERKMILALAARTEKEHMPVAETASREELKKTEAVLANAAMSFGMEKDAGPQGFWQKLVARTTRKQEEVATAAEEKASPDAPKPHTEAHAHDAPHREEHAAHASHAEPKREHSWQEAVGEKRPVHREEHAAHDRANPAHAHTERHDHGHESSWAKREGGEGFRTGKEGGSMASRIASQKAAEHKESHDPRGLSA